MIPLTAVMSIVSVTAIAVSIELAIKHNKLWHTMLGSIAAINVAFFVLISAAQTGYTQSPALIYLLMDGLRNALLALSMFSLLGALLSTVVRDNKRLKLWTALFIVTLPLSTGLAAAITAAESNTPLPTGIAEFTGSIGTVLFISGLTACAIAIIRRRWTATTWAALSCIGLALSEIAIFTERLPNLSALANLLFAVALITFAALLYEYQIIHLQHMFNGRNTQALAMLEKNWAILQRYPVTGLKHLSIATLYNIADIHHRVGRFDSSSVYLDKMNDYKPGKSFKAAQELLYAANLIMGEHRLDEAEDHLKNVLSSVVAPDAHLYMSYLYAIKNDDIKAKQALDNFAAASKFTRNPLGSTLILVDKEFDNVVRSYILGHFYKMVGDLEYAGDNFLAAARSSNNSIYRDRSLDMLKTLNA